MLDNIRELLQSEPFEPFTIVLTNGDRYDVQHPELIVVMESQVFFAYPRSNKWALLRVNQIAAVEVLGQAA